MTERAVFTYQTRLVLDAAQTAALDAYAALYGRAERSLFAAMRAGRSLNELKREFLPRFGLTARQFNALRVGLDGKRASIEQRRPELIAEAKWRIKKAEAGIGKLARRAAGTNKLHQKKRRLARLKARCAALEADQNAGTVRLCFGSKKLFRAQFDLAANGYASHDEWKADWQRVRANQFFVLGSQDETAGNQGCQARLIEAGSLALRIRLPDGLAARHGKYLDLAEVVFAYGQREIEAALAVSRRMPAATKAGKPIVKRIGAALSYRFLRDAKGWRVFASVEATPAARIARRELGALGVDANADHLAVAETDRCGNLVAMRRIDLPLFGKTSQQARALIGDAAATIVRAAAAAGKAVVIERLNFQRTKAELETADPRRARTISSFACRQIAAHLKAACFRAGVECIEVNAAYTSVIGAVNHARARGISVHMGAALAVARRGLGFAERPTVRTGVVPVRNGGHVTFDLPARNRSQHVWSFWSRARAKLKAAHAAHYRSGGAHAPPAPLTPATRSVCSHRSLPAQLRHANRSQHCSESVLDDLPW